MLSGMVILTAVAWGCSPEGPVVETAFGPVKGFEDTADTWVWKAIPFAKPPVGPLRWKAPQDPDPWEAVREYQVFSQPCAQSLADKIMGGEDCLYLNVWRPRTTDQDLPVYFWIHGGGNSLGMATLPDYSGANLAGKTDMVVISTSYRLGPLGWFTHPSLRSGLAGDEEDDSGNYGTLDLIKALSWVQNNIEAFGGDPGNVTIAGESAGGMNVLSLLISPLAQGLFHRAVCQSGNPMSSSVTQGEESAQAVILKLLTRDGMAADQAAAETYLAGMTNTEVQAYLRSKSIGQIIGSYDTLAFGMLSLPYIFTDGTVIPSTGYDTLQAGTYPNRVPIILGSNKEEMKLFFFMDPRFLGKEELYQIVTTYSSDSFFKAMGVDEVARKLRSHPDQPNVYAYQFLWGAGGDTGESMIPHPWGFLLGSCHALEVPFFFGNDTFNGFMQMLVFTEANRPGREVLSRAMMTYLAQFVRTGDPNQGGSDLPEWSQWSNTDEGPKALLFDVDENQALDIKMSTEELTAVGVMERMAQEVPEPLYSEAMAYLEGFMAEYD